MLGNFLEISVQGHMAHREYHAIEGLVLVISGRSRICFQMHLFLVEYSGSDHSFERHVDFLLGILCFFNQQQNTGRSTHLPREPKFLNPLDRRYA